MALGEGSRLLFTLAPYLIIHKKNIMLIDLISQQFSFFPFVYLQGIPLIHIISPGILEFLEKGRGENQKQKIPSFSSLSIKYPSKQYNLRSFQVFPPILIYVYYLSFQNQFKQQNQMSQESQYSLGEEASDEDYDNSSERKPRLRQVKTPRQQTFLLDFFVQLEGIPKQKNRNRFFPNGHFVLKTKGSSLSFLFKLRPEQKPVQEKRLTRRKINPLPKEISYNEEDKLLNARNYDDGENIDEQIQGGNEQQDEDQYSMFNLQIANIIWKRMREGTNQEEYLIKYRGKSYLHVEWLTEDELVQTVKSPKNKINRFNKTFLKRLSEGKYDEEAIEQEKYFDPAYCEVDRILTTTELFPIIHQKKANQIKGKWSQTLMVVCSKLLNFTHNKIQYGTPFCEPVNPERDSCPDYFEVIKNPMDLGSILNKIYLDIYKNSKEFWIDIGLVWKNCLKYNKTQNSDLRILGLTLRQCSIFLYDQWFHLCQERYNKLLEQFPHLATQSQPQNNVQSKMDIQNGQQKRQSGEKVSDNFKNHLEQVQNKIEGLQMQEQNVGEEKKKEQKSIPKQRKQDEQFESENEDENQVEVQNLDQVPQNLGDDSSEKPESSKKIQDDQERQYLNMDEFYQKNIFLTDKKVDNPTTNAQLQLLNPGQFSYYWLDDQTEDGNKFLSHSYEYIDRLDMKKIDLNVEVDRLYMVKWKNLSYSEATWELESVILCPDKIAEFKNINKALGKDARTLLDSQREKHLCIRDFELNRKKRFNLQQINDMKVKLYFMDVGTKKQPHQYNVENGPIYKHQKRLRNYQVESLNWIIRNWYQRRNMILADEMGLGKTIQSIAFLYHLFSVENVKGPFLIIAPLSTLEHWKRTVQDWTNMNCVLYYDQNGFGGRRSIQYYEWHHINITMKGLCQQSTLNKFQILITSYEVFMLDFNTMVLDIPFQFVIVDEAHRLKNKNAKILTSLKQLPCKRVLLLTGTPIQNNTGQLWSLLNYIHPEKFASHEMFKRQFGDLSNNEQVEKLNKVLKPYMIRRMKQDVQQSIPPLMQTIVDVEMTNIQKTIYRALYEKNKNMLIKGLSSTGTSSYNTNLNNLQIQLRKCCNHPCLIKELEHDLLRQCETYNDRIEKIINASGKMVLVSKLLQKCKKQGEKVLIFSQFTHMLQLIEQFLKYKEYKYERIDGQIKAKERQASIDRYNNPAKNRDVFLLSTKAGGVGINLTSANVVIIYDSDWNPQNDVQATARAHRIGQKNEVKVYRLVTSNTYETQMFERATQKLGLDKAIFIGGHFKDSTDGVPQENKISKQQMETLLKKGILGFLENHENQTFFEGQVEDIIAKNSRIAKYSMINGSCTFEKRTFTSNESDKELKLNDPNFWNIVLKNVESPTQQLLKKFKSMADFKDLESQKKLMLDAAELVNNLIENKLSLSGFNADDEINVSQFLTSVNSERQFHKHYRELASVWLEEICKPSRRFKKMTVQDLQIDKKILSKKNVTKTQQKDGGDIYVDQEREDQQIEESDDKLKLPNDQKKQQMLKKLCSLCEHPKCTFHCKSFCKRVFHAECRKKVQQENITSIDQITTKFEITELCRDQESLKQTMRVDWTCDDCKSNQVCCFICKNKGFYYGVQYQKSKKSKGKPGAQQKEVTPKNKRKNEVTKCSTANCSKYFHPKCVQSYTGKQHFKYIDSNSLHFRCSLHYCDKCGVSGDTMSILQCVRCPKALHIRCMDKEKILKLSKKQFICDIHFKNKKDLKKTSERFNLASLKKTSIKKQKTEKKKESEESQIQKQSPKIEKEKSEPEVIHHNYKTRRNRGSYNEDVMTKVRVVEDKKPVRVPVKDKNSMLTYEELGIPPIHEFDYENYDKDWCRYCGTRYSSNFTKGPWGSKTLCTVHYINWNTSKQLNLDEFKEKPKRPINPDSEQELKYITTFANKHPQMTRQQMIESLDKKNNKKQI